MNGYLNLIIENKDSKKVERFDNPNIFKCIVFPYENDNILKDVVENYFNRLNISSADYLDIYYSKSDLLISGFELKNKIKNLKVSDSDIPCIVIWKENIESRAIIPIDGLNDDGILKILLKMIDITKTTPKATPESISKLARKNYKDLITTPIYTKSTKRAKEPIKVKLLWLILVPLLCAVVGGIVSGVAVYYITNPQTSHANETIVLQDIQ